MDNSSLGNKIKTNAHISDTHLKASLHVSTVKGGQDFPEKMDLNSKNTLHMATESSSSTNQNATNVTVRIKEEITEETILSTDRVPLSPDCRTMAPTKATYSVDKKSPVEAISAVRNGLMNAMQAAAEFNVPKSTLCDNLEGNSPIFSKNGPMYSLPEKHEKVLVDWIKSCSDAGFPVMKSQILKSVSKLVEELKIQTPFKNNQPGERWYDSFLRRHLDLSIPKPRNLALPQANVTETQIRKWFNDVQIAFETGKKYQFWEIKEEDKVPDDPKVPSEVFILGNEKNAFEILKDATRVFNGDEALFFYNPQKESVLYKKGSISERIFKINDEECVVILTTVSAAGARVPPMIVLKSEQIPEKEVAHSIPCDWDTGLSKSGWTTSDTFFGYIKNIFEPWLIKNNIKRPVIFFVDGRTAHVTLYLSKFCWQKKIILVAIPSNATDLIQPLDVTCFEPLKQILLQIATIFRVNNSRPVITKTEFFPLLAQAMSGALTVSAIQAGFKKCGLLPWDPNAVDYTKIPAVPTGALKLENVQTNFKKWKIVADHLSEFLGPEKEELFKKMRNALNWMEIVEVRDHTLFEYWRHVDSEVYKESLDEPLSDLDVTTQPHANVSHESEIKVLTNGGLKDKKSVVPLTKSNFVAHKPQSLTASVSTMLSASNLLVEPRIPSQKSLKSARSIPPHSKLSTSGSCNDTTPKLASFQQNKTLKSALSTTPYSTSQNRVKSKSALSVTPHVFTRSNAVKKTCRKSSEIAVSQQFILPKGRTPFKRFLTWPEGIKKLEEDDKKLKTTRESISSAKWRTYYEKLEAGEKAAAEEKSRKKAERERKQKELAKKQQTETAKNVTKSEVPKKKRKFQDKALHDSPKNKKTSIQSSVKANDFVIVKYEDNFFPGIVLEKEATAVSVKTMAIAGIDVWKWPQKDDVCLYEFQNVQMIIKPPKLFNNRGHFKVSEMKNFN